MSSKFISGNTGDAKNENHMHVRNTARINKPSGLLGVPIVSGGAGVVDDDRQPHPVYVHYII